jgi:cyclic pyranopterin phosphate synthase
MPEEGIHLIKHEDILSFEEILDVVKSGVGMGINKVRITGGEPLVRKGIVDLTGMISSVEGITDLSLTTNGTLLENFAPELAKSGLNRVNISLDTIDEQKYSEITRGGDIHSVLKGIVAAKTAGLEPIKINCVIRNSREEKDAVGVRKFSMKNGLQVRFIRQMSLKNGDFSVVEGGDGGNCSICNRLRLTANGKIKPCLFSDLEYDVRELGVEQAILMALGDKPLEGTKNRLGDFYNIGG